MASTGIELGPDSCVLVGVRPARKGVADVMALHIIEPSWWPEQDVALVETLLSARRTKGFPRTARVIAWGLPEAPAIDDPITRAMLRPITSAGFRVASILTPPQALALLAASRPRSSGEGAVAWLALNVHAAAIAIVSRGQLLFARTFAWSYSGAAMSTKAQLLQRYSLVAQLAPEVHHAIAAVRASHGITVDGVVTCGDLSELRSLTMPLIEELDLEVETLDSTEGLRAVGKARIERFAESAPAIRLACAVALAPSSRQGLAVPSLGRVAAAIGIIAVLGWGAYAYWRTPVVRPATVEQSAPRNPAAAPAVRRGAPPQAAARGPANAAAREQVIAQGPASAAASPGSRQGASREGGSPMTTTAGGATTPPQGRPPTPAVSVPPAAPRSLPSAPPKVEPKPVPSPPPKVQSKPVPPAPSKVVPNPVPPAPPKVEPKPLPANPATAAPVTGSPPKSRGPATVTPPATAEPKSTSPPSAKVEPKPTSPPVAKVEPKPGSPVPAKVEAPPSLDPPVTAGASRQAIPFPEMVEPPPSRTPNRRQVPLKDPLPKVDSVLIDQDRRLAIIDGVIVAIGDAVGQRVVVQIDRDAVVLREPSGLSVRIPVRSRMTI